jgi:hypothetical protein
MIRPASVRSRVTPDAYLQSKSHPVAPHYSNYKEFLDTNAALKILTQMLGMVPSGHICIRNVS